MHRHSRRNRGRLPDGIVDRAMIKVLIIFGTRPEAIKLAPVIQELAKHSAYVDTKVCITAQHREMLDQVMALFQIRPDYDLDIMEENQSLSHITAATLKGVENVLSQFKPDWIFVQGDTTAAMVGALVGFYHRMKVGHVEAGLRTWNKYHPYPEEVNRNIISILADFHFAPTNHAKENLLREGCTAESILVTGNTVIDAVQWAANLPVNQKLKSFLDDLKLTNGDGRSVVLVTAHRRENFGDPLIQICRAIRRIAEENSGKIRFIYPVHLNPNVQEPVRAILSSVPNVTLLPPVDYLQLIQLMKLSHFVLTDSGGIQEEAPGLGKPVLLLRELTERPEAVEAGTVKIIGTDEQKVHDEIRRLLEDETEYNRMARAVNPYGDGHASERIVQALIRKC